MNEAKALHWFCRQEETDVDLLFTIYRNSGHTICLLAAKNNWLKTDSTDFYWSSFAASPFRLSWRSGVTTFHCDASFAFFGHILERVHWAISSHFRRSEMPFHLWQHSHRGTNPSIGITDLWFIKSSRNSELSTSALVGDTLQLQKIILNTYSVQVHICDILKSVSLYRWGAQVFARTFVCSHFRAFSARALVERYAMATNVALIDRQWKGNVVLARSTKPIL